MVEVNMNMNHVSRYPNFNNPPYTERPILSMYGRTVLGELVWMSIPLAVLILAVIFR
jgi:hypothetical protein